MVYEPIRTSVRLTGDRWLTCVRHRFFLSVDAKQALSGARADGAAGRCTSSFRYRIEHTTSLAKGR